MPIRILLVEDDSTLSNLMAEYLQPLGHDVIQAGSAEAALELARGNRIDFAIIDWRLPGASGDEFCRELRRLGYTGPVALLTGLSGPDCEMRGHSQGANFYWTKPVPLPLLAARIRAALAAITSVRGEDEPVRVAPGAEFHPGRGMLVVDGLEVILPAKHAGILHCLAKSPGTFVSREDLLARVWRFKVIPHTRTVDNYVSALRKRLAGLLGDAVAIESKRGMGYRLVPRP